MSRHIFYAASTGLYIFIYRVGKYTDPADRVQALDSDNNKIYWFDVDALDEADNYDIGVYSSNPGNGDHEAVYTAQKKDEKENRYFGSATTITFLVGHTADTDNPHETTLTQVILEEGTDENLTVVNLVKLVDGSDAGGLHSHSSAVSLEVVGTGTGSDKTFAITLDKFPAVPGTIVITDTVENFSDNGAGVLTGDDGGSGTINYATGVGSVTFKVNVTLSQDITANYNYSKYTPEAHKATHKTGGADAFGAKDLDASMSAITDAGNLITADNVEGALQEIAAKIVGVLAVPTGLTVTHTAFQGLKAVLHCLWDAVVGAIYDLYIENLTTHAVDIKTFIGTYFYDYEVNSDATYKVKVASRTVQGTSAYCTAVNHVVSDIGDLINIKEVSDKVTQMQSNYQTQSTEGCDIYGPESESQTHDQDGDGNWNKFIVDTYEVSKGTNTNKIYIKCLLATSNIAKEAKLRLKLTYADGSYYYSAIHSSVTNGTGKKIESYWNLLKDDKSPMPTGIPDLDLEVNAEAGVTITIGGLYLRATK